MKSALITGASRGLGKAIAIALSADHGYHVLINYSSNKDAAQDTLDKVTSNGGSGEIMRFDVSKKAEVDSSLEVWHREKPDSYINVLVNNAGITKDNLFMWMNEEDWDSVINISLKGVFNCTQAVIGKMLRKRQGRIINIASLSGLKGVPGQTNYSAAKGGVIAATKALAQEVAKRNVTVNAIAPGFISTDMTEDLDSEALSKLVPANRFGEASEVADLVSFLASDKASYITGEVININGGLYS
jgi:3-oxoacyl-[acyl-carrier protein] reductase